MTLNVKVTENWFLGAVKTNNVDYVDELVLTKDTKHYYYNTFLEKCLYQLAKKQSQKIFRSIIMLRFGEAKVKKENFYAAKNL